MLTRFLITLYRLKQPVISGFKKSNKKRPAGYPGGRILTA